MQANKIPRLLSNIRTSGHRAAQIVNNMLSFSRVSDSRLVNCRIERILDETLDLACCTHHPVKEYNIGSIKIIKDYDEELPKVPCDPVMLQQVFLNIIMNAADAFAAAEGTLENDKDNLLRISTKDKGGSVEVRFSDNGPGLDRDSSAQIFDPFYTTKEPGEGTGLGLSVCYRILEEMGGSIGVESEEGKGTTLWIKLPVHLVKGSS